MLVGIPPYYNDNVRILYQNIEKGKLKLPKYLSPVAKKCLLRMLNKNPSKRPTLDQMMHDKFFADINWKKLEKMQIDPPSTLKQMYRPPFEEESQPQRMKDEDMSMLFESH